MLTLQLIVGKHNKKITTLKEGVTNKNF